MNGKKSPPVSKIEAPAAIHYSTVTQFHCSCCQFTLLENSKHRAASYASCTQHAYKYAHPRIHQLLYTQPECLGRRISSKVRFYSPSLFQGFTFQHTDFFKGGLFFSSRKPLHPQIKRIQNNVMIRANFRWLHYFLHDV